MVNSLKSILAKPSDKSEFLEKRFPIIFVLEDTSTSIIEEIGSDGEYRSKNPLTIGEHIKIIATDLQSHQKMIQDYLNSYNRNHVKVILFDDLRESKQRSKKVF